MRLKALLPPLLLLLLLFVACGSKPPQTSPQSTLLQTTLDELVDSIADDCQLPSPTIMDDILIAGLLDIDVDDIVQYHGYITMQGDACDQIIAIEAKEGKAKEIARKLEARLKFVIEDARSGSKQKLERAQSGTVYQKDNYLFLIIVGHPDADPKTATAELIEKIEDNFFK